VVKTILLVDYENVRDIGLTHLPEGHNRILLFIGKQQLEARNQKPEPTFVKDILDKGARLDLIPIAEQGGNNLDLHLAFYLGKVLAEEPQAHYIILTKDKTDFGPLIAHLQKRGVSCERRQPPVTAALPAQTSQQKTKSPAPVRPGKTKETPQKPAALKPSERKAAAPSPRKTAATKAAEKNSAVKPVGDLESVLSFLKALGKSRPTTRKKLANHLGPHYRKEWPNVNFLIDALEKHGSIRFTPKEDVEYIF
jgi:hypothetical protein